MPGGSNRPHSRELVIFTLWNSFVRQPRTPNSGIAGRASWWLVCCINALTVSDAPLTPALQQFISRHIHSVEQIEILSIVSATPAKNWTAAEVFRVVQSSERSVAETLEAFCKAGLLISERSGAYQFAPKSTELRQGASDLVKAYRERRVTIVETIYKRPADRIQH